MATLKAIFAAIAAVFGLTRERSALRNSTAMQASKTAKTDAAIRGESTAAVAAAKSGDTKAIDNLRHLTSE